MPELEAFTPSSNSQEVIPMGKGGQQNGNLSDSASESDIDIKDQDTISIKSDHDSVSIKGDRDSRDIPTVLNVVAAVLERLVARNERTGGTLQTLSPLNAKKLTSFHGLRAPGISISKYMERIFKYTNCSPSCFVVGYIYIDRLIHKQPDMPVTLLNVHRLLVTAVMVAAKMLDDVHFNNAFYARVGGVSVVELNRLEIELLDRLDFRLQVPAPEFEFYCTHLEKQMLRSDSIRVDRSLPLPSPTLRSPAQSPLLTTPKKHLTATFSGTFDRSSVHALIARQISDSPSR
ncbi:unnamed protein product [Calypogeia fissa]